MTRSRRRAVVSAVLSGHGRTCAAAPLMKEMVVRAASAALARARGTAMKILIVTPYAGTRRIRFNGTLSACAICGQAPRSQEESREVARRAGALGAKRTERCGEQWHAACPLLATIHGNQEYQMFHTSRTVAIVLVVFGAACG